jgi:hypothetical protein
MIVVQQRMGSVRPSAIFEKFMLVLREVENVKIILKAMILAGCRRIGCALDSGKTRPFASGAERELYLSWPRWMSHGDGCPEILCVLTSRGRNPRRQKAYTFPRRHQGFRV